MTKRYPVTIDGQTVIVEANSKAEVEKKVQAYLKASEGQRQAVESSQDALRPMIRPDMATRLGAIEGFLDYPRGMQESLQKTMPKPPYRAPLQ